MAERLIHPRPNYRKRKYTRRSRANEPPRKKIKRSKKDDGEVYSEIISNGAPTIKRGKKTKSQRKKKKAPKKKSQRVTSKKKSKQRTEKSLRSLAIRFVELVQNAEDQSIDLNDATERLEVSKRRIYDITNVLEGIELVEKKTKNVIQWKGKAMSDDEDEKEDEIIFSGVVTPPKNRFKKRKEPIRTRSKTRNTPVKEKKKKVVKKEKSDEKKKKEEEKGEEGEINEAQILNEIARLEETKLVLEQHVHEKKEFIKKISENHKNLENAFVSYQDICTLRGLIGRTVVAIRAPPFTTLTVPDPDEGMTPPERRFQIFLNSDTGPIQVFLVSDEKDSKSNIIGGSSHNNDSNVIESKKDVKIDENDNNIIPPSPQSILITSPVVGEREREEHLPQQMSPPNRFQQFEENSPFLGNMGSLRRESTNSMKGDLYRPYDTTPKDHSNVFSSTNTGRRDSVMSDFFGNSSFGSPLKSPNQIRISKTPIVVDGPSTPVIQDMSPLRTSRSGFSNLELDKTPSTPPRSESRIVGNIKITKMMVSPLGKFKGMSTPGFGDDDMTSVLFGQDGTSNISNNMFNKTNEKEK